MGVQTSAADFRRAIEIASKAVGTRSTIPVLSTLRCKANGRLQVTGTDLDISLSAFVDRVPGNETAFALTSPRPIIDAVKAGGGDTVELTPDNDRHVELASGALSLKVGIMPADDFPIDGDRPLDVGFTATLSAEHVRLIDRVASAISTEETRYYLNGVYLRHVAGTTYQAAATDGHRLCCIDLELPDATGEFPGIIIPRKAIALMHELGGKATGDIKLALGVAASANREETTAPARAGMPRLNLAFDIPGAGIDMQSKLIDGTYPDYTRVIPAGNDKTALFNPADLRRALRAVSGHSKKIRAVRVALTNEGANLSAAYTGLDLEASIDIPCQHRHAGFEIGLNGNYLLAMIDAAEGDELVLTMADAAAPVLVKNAADTAWTGVLMPMRL